MDNLGKLLGELHLAVGKDFLEKIQTGQADASVLREASKFLKDNDIKYDVDLNDKHITQLRDAVIEIEDIPFEQSERFKMVQ